MMELALILVSFFVGLMPPPEFLWHIGQTMAITPCTELHALPIDTLHGKVVKIDHEKNETEILLTIQPKETYFTLAGIPEKTVLGDWVHFNIVNLDGRGGVKFKGKAGKFLVLQLRWVSED